MNLTKYQALLKTTELGSITKAAEVMGYTQSAVSRAIAELEREWGLELLTRSRGGIALSSSGEVLLPAIQGVCNAAKALEEQVAELHGMTRGTLRVGTFTSVSIHWLPAIMKVFLDRYPGIHFELVSSWEFAEIEDLIRRGQVDCGFLRVPAGADLDTISLRQDRLLAVLPPDHPLAHASCYPIARFTQEPYIRLSEERDMEIRRIFQEEGVRPNLQYTVNDDFAILAMVEQGLGVSIMPELVLRSSNRQFSAIPLDHPRFREIGLAVRSGRPPSPLTAHFLSCVQELVAQMEPGMSAAQA